MCPRLSCCEFKTLCNLRYSSLNISQLDQLSSSWTSHRNLSQNATTPQFRKFLNFVLEPLLSMTITSAKAPSIKINRISKQIDLFPGCADATVPSLISSLQGGHRASEALPARPCVFPTTATVTGPMRDLCCGGRDLCCGGRDLCCGGRNLCRRGRAMSELC